MARREWTPLFSGQEAARYERAIDDIVEALDTREPEPINWGLPLLHAYLARARGSARNRERALAMVSQVVEAMGRQTLRPALYGGFSGIAWTAAHIDKMTGTGDDGAYEEIDVQLLEERQQPRGPFLYDLIGGEVGIGVYFLERLPDPHARAGLEKIAKSLERNATENEGLVTWLTAPVLLPEWQRQLTPAGHYNLGVAHGVPGVVGLLADLAHLGLLDRSGERLLTGAIRWVLSHATPEGDLPSWVAEGPERTQQRVAWCYGPFGAAIMLLKAARAVGDETIEHRSTTIALRLAARREDARVADGCLCHGAAGNAHLFNRLHQVTSVPVFREAAIYWYQRTLEMRVPGRGIGGFQTWRGEEQGGFADDASFLSGVSGIALALLAATSAVPPGWDRLLLCDLSDL